MYRKLFAVPMFLFAASAAFAADFTLPSIMVRPDQHVLDPERTIDDVYPGAPAETMYRVATARVVIADYALLRRDFPFLKDKTPAQIDQWLLDSGGAYVSESQIKQAVVNTPIQIVEGDTRQAYRPATYGRAAVYDVGQPGSPGLIDINGCGMAPGKIPSHNSHGNGIGTLAEKLRDFAFENAFRAGLVESNSKIGSVGSYAVISYGFDVRYADGNTVPAGLYMRQAHKRLSYQEGNVRAAWLPAERKKEVWDHLSRYGFYTGWEGNIQGIVKNGETFVFDFGHWIAWQGQVPETGIWVDPNVAPEFNRWGWDSWNGPDRRFDQWRTSQMDYTFDWARNVSWKYKFGQGGVEAVQDFYERLVGDYLRKLSARNPLVAQEPTKEDRSFRTEQRLIDSGCKGIFGLASAI